MLLQKTFFAGYKLILEQLRRVPRLDDCVLDDDDDKRAAARATTLRRRPAPAFSSWA